MKNKRFWWAWVVVSIYIIFYEWAFHGGILAGLYESTASIWRPEDDMPQYIGWMMAGQLLFSVVFCWLYTCTQCQSSVKDGACYGLVIGLMMSSASFIYYAVLPIPLSLFVLWVIGGVIETVVAGMILYWVYQPTPHKE